ncbi:MAG: T9SS type A sorting domain-containing protein [Bacteroidetes bacterium]|nr:T9SS type A sorting domain-containing protein [Bacteroidota bacterium]MBU1114530.1 T9SS type A sorting domain-containing protein [Bacteroidota bacterium]MBU1799923.1 T9SS type A sorting domain-containing protein [Bacteroidota bacterium]
MLYRVLNIFLIMLVFTITGFAQNTPGPYLLSPSNNSTYIQTNKLKLSWLKLDGEDFYKVQHSLDSNFAPSSIEENIVRYRADVTISLSEFNSQYFWRVKADKNNSDWSEVWKFTTTGKPVTPNLIAPINLVNNQPQTVIFSWDSNPINTKYQIHISSFSNFSDTVKLVEQSDTLVEIAGLKTNTIYFWHVKSYNIDGLSGNWSEKSEFKTILSTPTQSYPLNYTNNIDTVLTLRWNSVASASNYIVQLSNSQFFEDETEIISRNALTNKLDIDYIRTNQIYYWKVLAINTFNDSSNWTDVYRFKTKLTPPNLVLPSDSANNINKNLTLKWNDNSDFDSYNIQVALDKNFNSIALEEETNRDSLFVNLENSKTYFWRVSGKNNLGDVSSWSKVNQFKTKLNPPTFNFPKNFANNIDTIFTLSWSEIANAINYNVQISTDEFFKDEEKIISANIITNKLELDSLETNMIYYWKVFAVNVFNDSSNWSDTYQFKTKIKSPYLVYPKDSSNNINKDFSFRWNKSPDFDSYSIQVSLDTNFSKIILDKEVESDSLFANLNNWTTYFWRISGKNKLGGISYWSKINQFKTKLAKPKLVSPKDSSYSLSNNYNFIWKIVLGADKYQFQLSKVEDFSSKLFNKTTIDSSFVIDSLSLNSVYFWRVMAFNTTADSSNWSSIFQLNTTTIVVETDSIFTEFNYSKNATDTIGTVSIYNYGDSEANFQSISVSPDSIFSTNISSLLIYPNSSREITILGDTTKIDTGFYFGNLKIIQDTTLLLTDTIKIPILTYALKSIAKVSTDSLIYDTVSVSSNKKKMFVLSNSKGNYQLNVLDFMLSGNDTSAFKIINIPKIIPPGDSTTITVEFKPTVLDSNNATLILETNSYPNKYITINLVGIGKGGNFAEATIKSLIQLSDTTFETLTDNNKKILFRNNGNEAISFSTSFVEKYFRKIELASTIKLNPGDSTTVTFQYSTPNFDSLNIDTLKIYHNGFGDNPLSIPFSGTFDSVKTSKRIIDALSINNKLFTNNDYVFEEKKSISFSLNENLFKEQENLVFKINYFMGGPGEKQTALNGGEAKYIITYQNVTNSGLLFKAELFTKASTNFGIDSVTIFNFKNAQIIFDNYSSPVINVPKSKAGYTSEEANTKWVLFGFPFENVIADSIFSQFGGIKNTEDGEWIVYNYENDLNGFKPFSNYSFTPGVGYFIAQSLQSPFAISYNYANQISSRKLTDTKIIMQNSDGWNTISSPFTFPIEVESPAILYKYDSNNLRYRLTNIMWPGEAYFVEPNISELNLKTYGEYYPNLFPKISAEINWSVELVLNGKNETDEIVVSLLDYSKSGLSKVQYLNPPNINNGLDAYITTDNNSNKYYAHFANGIDGAVWNITLANHQIDDLVIISKEISENFPKHFSVILLDENNAKTEKLNLQKGVSHNCKLIIGTDEFILKTTNDLKLQVPTKFMLAQNYPNPFNPSTKIDYQIAKDGFVSLVIYNALGQKVAKLVNQHQSIGRYSVNFDASNLSSGVYFYKLQSGSFNVSKKMIILK